MSHPVPTPSPAEIELPKHLDDSPGIEIPLPQVGAELARLTAENASLRVRLAESRAQTDGAIEIHAKDAEKRSESHAAEVRALEAILDHLDREKRPKWDRGDWRLDFTCPRCEENLRYPDEDVCVACGPFAEGDAA